MLSRSPLTIFEQLKDAPCVWNAKAAKDLTRDVVAKPDNVNTEILTMDGHLYTKVFPPKPSWILLRLIPKP